MSSIGKPCHPSVQIRLPIREVVGYRWGDRACCNRYGGGGREEIVDDCGCVVDGARAGWCGNGGIKTVVCEEVVESGWKRGV